MKLSDEFRRALKRGVDQTCPDLRALNPQSFKPLSSAGLSHDHVRLGKSGWLLRIPRSNQLGMSPLDYLRLQEICFTTSACSGHAPSVRGFIPPSQDLPNGALIVEEIKGRKATRPKDARAIASALSAIHQIRPGGVKLETAAKPMASQHFLIANIFGGAIARAHIPDQSKDYLKAEKKEVLKGLNKIGASNLPLSLVGGDSHPANFLIKADGAAVLVDVEFAMFDTPYIDLADASLPITQNLDPSVKIWPEKVRAEFYETWKKSAGSDLVDGLREGREQAERAVHLRTLLWLADWTAKPEADKGNISKTTRKNWDKMAQSYLKPQNLARDLKL